MANKIVSCGQRHGIPTDGEVIDVRKLLTRNPFHDKSLRKLRGTDPRVVADLMLTPGIHEAIDRFVQLAWDCDQDTLYVMCTGGHHRSVFMAEILGKRMGVPVEHRDIDKA